MKNVLRNREKKIKSYRNSKVGLIGQNIEHKKMKGSVSVPQWRKVKTNTGTLCVEAWETVPNFSFIENSFTHRFLLFMLEKELHGFYQGFLRLRVTNDTYETLDYLRIDLEWEYGIKITMSQLIGSIIRFMHSEILNVSEIHKVHDSLFSGNPREDGFHKVSRFDEKLRVPSRITTMNCEIEEGTCVILCDYIEDDVMMTLIALMELLNLESLEDLIRLFIFRLLSTTNPYYERFPVEMEVLLDPLYQEIGRAHV